MEITVQYLEGCPNIAVLRERLAAVGVDLSKVRFEEVASPEDADRVGCLGSPSILVDGQDRFAAGSSPVGFACRVYQTASGREGAPSLAQLQTALNL